MLSIHLSRAEISGERLCIRWQGQRATPCPTDLKEVSTS